MTAEPVDTWFEEQFRDKYQEHADKLGRFNLAIFGKTGVGKSTLINAVFGEDLAATGVGEPVTTDGHLYLSSAGFLGLYDTVGLEIGDDTEIIIGELDALVRKNKEKELDQQIHAVWYCVSAESGRIEPTEADFIRHVRELELPLVLVITQSEMRNGEYKPKALELAEVIRNLRLPINEGPILVMAYGDSWSGAQHGLVELLDATFRVVPDAVAAALTAAQQIDLARKRKGAATAIATAVVAAAATGAVPIPLAASAVLVPLQVGMITSISVIYGLKLSTASTAAMLLPAIATGAGKTAVVSLLKLVPGPGSIIGGVINAATAGVLTAAMGYAWAAVCERIISDGGAVIDEDVLSTLFNAEFVAQFTKRMASGKSE